MCKAVLNSTQRVTGIYREAFTCVMGALWQRCLWLKRYTFTHMATGRPMDPIAQGERHVDTNISSVDISRLICGLMNYTQNIWEVNAVNMSR